MIKRTHLRQFLAVAETGTFTAAARQLNVTQPTLSAGIAELERVLGTLLFLRAREHGHRTVRLTDAGSRLLGTARTIEREFRQAETLGQQPALPAPPLRLGVLASLPSRALAALSIQYAGTRPLALTEGSDADLRRRMADGRIDAALTLLGAADDSECLLDEGYAMVLPATHPLATRSRLTPEELAGEVMIARRACEILPETSRYFTARGVRPRFVLRSHNDDRCLALVAAGAGITTAPWSLAMAGTIAVPLDGYDFRRRIGLVEAAGGRIDPALRTGLTNLARKVLRARSQAGQTAV